MRNTTRQSMGTDADTKVDLTPMLDMVFILIIFFIVSASFTHEPGVSINRPDAAPTPLKESAESFVFTIKANDAVDHKGYALEIEAVSAIAKRIYTEDPEQNVIIRLNDNASHDAFIAVYDQLRLSGFPVHQIPIISFVE